MKPKPQPKGGRHPDAFSFLTFILIGLALVSVIVLDRINWKKGEPSFIFLPLSKTKAPQAKATVEEKPTVPVPSAKEKPEERGEAVKKAQIKEGPAAEKKTTPALPEAKGQVALIVDDMGNSLEVLQELISLERPVTIAVLPTSVFAKETAQTAHDNGLEVILHLPLESLNNHDASGSMDGTIQTGMNEEEVTALVEEGFNQVPHIKGVNNHMGSKFMSDEEKLKLIFRRLKKKNLFFIDSRTTANSKALSASEKIGLPLASRKIFLDNSRNYSETYKILVEIAEVTDTVDISPIIIIGHPYPETIRAIKDATRILRAKGVTIVPVSKLIKNNAPKDSS